MINYKNPVCAGADPFILLDNGRYYHYATATSSEGYTVRVSDDLVTWEEAGVCLRKEDLLGSDCFWAPELLKHNGKYYMAYSANRHLGIAVADSPLGPFRQHSNGFLFEDDTIDGHFLKDDDGKIYLFYVNCMHGNRIFAAEMNEDLTDVIDGTDRLILAGHESAWERSSAGPCAEGPFVLKHGGRYYLTYSANDYQDPNYSVGLAIAEKPLGPYVKYAKNPILKRSETVVGTGHHSFTTAKDEKTLLCVYHCHKSLNKVHPRMTCIDRADFVYDEDLGYDTLKNYGPTDKETQI